MKIKVYALFLFFTSLQTFAQGVPNIFQAGDPAVAADVNDNFTFVTDRLDSMEVDVSDLQSGQPEVYSFQDYTTSISVSQKSYSVSNAYDYNPLEDDVYTDCIPTRSTWSYTHGNDNGVSTISTQRINQNDTQVCNVFVRNYQVTEDQLVQTDFTFNDPNNFDNVISTWIYEDDGLKVLSDSKLGQTKGDAAVRMRSENGNLSMEIGSYTLVAIESVTVPYGTFDDCLVVKAHYPASKVTRVDSNTMDWLCPGVGMVKRIRKARYGNGIFELTGLQN